MEPGSGPRLGAQAQMDARALGRIRRHPRRTLMKEWSVVKNSCGVSSGSSPKYDSAPLRQRSRISGRKGGEATQAAALG